MIRALIVCLLLASGGATAVEPDEMLKDPAMEARARDVSQALRCVVCQNETIDESNAELAGDMRRLVRARISAGDTNQQVIDYMVDRYGDFVLLKPRFTATTLALWAGPFVILVVGAMVVMRRLKPRAAEAPLTAEETAALRAMSERSEGA